MKTYICSRCDKEIRAYAVPTLLVKLKTCAECYHKLFLALHPEYKEPKEVK